MVADGQEVPAVCAGDALRALLSAVLFHRALGPLKPVVRTVPRLDVAYSAATSSEVDAVIDAAVAESASVLEPIAPDMQRLRVVLEFYTLERRDSFLGIALTSDKVVWERWAITILASESAPVDGAEAPDQLRESLLRIAATASASTRHLPPIDFGADVPVFYRFEVRIIMMQAKCQMNESANNKCC